MTKPIPNSIDSLNEGWDADIADNFGVIFDAPMPPKEVANMATLNADFPASAYDGCIAVITDATAGKIIVLSDGANWKKIGRQAANVASLTDNVAGSAGSSLQAIPNPANSPANADDLRDDIVNNVLPPLRNDLTRLNNLVNALTAAMIASGQMAAP